MNLKTATSKKTGRTYLSIVHAYRDEKGKPRTKTVQSLGYLDKLKLEFDDPIAHFKAIAAEMETARRQANAPVTITFYPEQKMRKGDSTRKNIGFCALSRVYHELFIDDFFDNRQRHAGFSYSLDSIFRLLVFDRALNPHSKRGAYAAKDSYFENFGFSSDDMYRALSRIASHKEALIRHLDEQICLHHGRDRALFYYDVTNYYFEIDAPDEMRKKGVSKEHRVDPIIQMGLLMDSGALPVTYELYPGNTNDCNTLIDLLATSRKDLGAERIVVVADKGLNTSDNIFALVAKGDGYVFSQSVRGASDEMRTWATSEAGFGKADSEGFMLKSRIATRKIRVTIREADKAKGIKRQAKTSEITEKQVAFYSQKYADRAKRERAEAVSKARAMVASPPKLKAMLEHTAARYVIGLDVDADGVIVDTQEVLSFDEERLAKEEALDGYYIICTSEHAMPDAAVVDAYRGLWRIEETFKITKSDLEARPVFLSRAERIQAHFLICFVALLILRILQKRTGWKHSAGAISQTLSRANATLEAENWYLFDHYDEVLSDVGEALGMDFRRKRLSRMDAVHMVASTKKVSKS